MTKSGCSRIEPRPKTISASPRACARRVWDIAASPAGTSSHPYSRVGVLVCPFCAQGTDDKCTSRHYRTQKQTAANCPKPPGRAQTTEGAAPGSQRVGRARDEDRSRTAPARSRTARNMQSINHHHSFSRVWGVLTAAGLGRGPELRTPAVGFRRMSERGPAGCGQAERLRVPVRLIKQAAGRVGGGLR